MKSGIFLLAVLFVSSFATAQMIGISYNKFTLKVDEVGPISTWKKDANGDKYFDLYNNQVVADCKVKDEAKRVRVAIMRQANGGWDRLGVMSLCEKTTKNISHNGGKVVDMGIIKAIVVP